MKNKIKRIPYQKIILFTFLLVIVSLNFYSYFIDVAFADTLASCNPDSTYYRQSKACIPPSSQCDCSSSPTCDFPPCFRAKRYSCDKDYSCEGANGFGSTYSVCCQKPKPTPTPSPTPPSSCITLGSDCTNLGEKRCRSLAERIQECKLRPEPNRLGFCEWSNITDDDGNDVLCSSGGICVASPSPHCETPSPSPLPSSSTVDTETLIIPSTTEDTIIPPLVDPTDTTTDPASIDIPPTIDTIAPITDTTIDPASIFTEP